MDTKDVNILVWDDENNFNLDLTRSNLGIFDGKSGTYKKVLRFFEVSDMDTVLKEVDDNELVFVLCHIHIKSLIGYNKFKLLLRQYPNLKNRFLYVSSNREAHKQFYDDTGIKERILTYSDATAEIEKMQKIPTKKELLDLESKDTQTDNSLSLSTHFDYAIIAALYEDEFTQLKTVFDFPEDKERKIPVKIRSDCFVYYEGHLKSNSNKKVIVAVQRKTGMIDASIVATQMLEMFSPKYLLMSGVCGGGSDNKYGDVIVANEVFTFQKGKISDITTKNKAGKNVKIQLYDREKKMVDYEHLYDKDGKQIVISIEKFDKDPDSIDLKNHIIEKITEKKTEIESEINKAKTTMFLKTKIEVKIGPIACSTMIINKDGFFEDTIRAINRKTAAVEMESYGVARACHFANKGETTPIIFKSVMDFTKGKKDIVNSVNVKGFAAWTSAQFMKCLFEMNII